GEVDVTDLDASGGRADAEIRRHPRGNAARPIDDRVEQGILGGRRVRHPGTERLGPVERAGGEVGPARALRVLRVRRPQARRVFIHPQRHDLAPPPHHRLPDGRRRRL
ncbi:MAG: hypothetical protein ACK559_01095, partial [bacterium]